MRLKDETLCTMYVLLAGLLCLSSCLQSPRSSLFRQQSSSTEQSRTQASVGVADPERFRDTSYRRILSPGSNVAADAFSAAQQDFDQQHYEEARQECEHLLETLDDADSLHAEAAFLLAECYVQRNTLDDAVTQLEALRTQHLNPGITERSTLRLGQVYCLLGKDDKARATFADFRRRFPQSPYLQLASCTSVH